MCSVVYKKTGISHNIKGVSINVIQIARCLGIYGVDVVSDVCQLSYTIECAITHATVCGTMLLSLVHEEFGCGHIGKIIALRDRFIRAHFISSFAKLLFHHHLVP